MKRLGKVLAAAGIAALVALPAQQAEGYRWGPGYGTVRHTYVYDPAYRFGPPTVKRYIRDLYRYGPGYASWRRHWRYW